MIQKILNLIRSNSFKTLSIFAGGNILVAVLGSLGGILQSRWVTPEVLGEFRKYAILSGYLNIGLIIVQDALMRQYPYLTGKGDQEEALKVVVAAKWWYMTLSYLFSTLFIGLTLLSLFRGDLRAAVGWAVQIIMVWSSFYGIYLGVMYRTSQDFKRLTYNNMLSTFLGVILLVAVKVWGYWGIAFRNGLQLLANLWLNHKYVPVRVKGAFDRVRLIELAKMSLPISVPGYISTSLMGTTLSLLILNYLGHSGLGIYSIAITLQSMAMIVTQAIGQMFYPRIMSKFGESDDYWSSLKYTIKPTCFSLAISIGIAVVLCLTIETFIKIAIPEYVDAISIIRILSLNIVLTAVELPFIVFVSALKYRTIISLALVRFVCCFGLIAIFPKTLPMIVWSTIIAELAYVVAGYGLIVITPARVLPACKIM